MEYLFNMGLAGSLMWILYLLIKLTVKGRLSDNWRYVMLKCVLIYYLIPIPFLKRFYSYVWKLSIFTENKSKWFVLYTDEYRVLLDTDRIYLNQSLTLHLIIGGILTGLAVVVFVHKMRKYLRKRRVLLRCRNGVTADFQNEEFCKALQRDAGIKRDIIYIDSTPADAKGNTAFTIGIWKPVILYPVNRNSHETKLILEHELQHVKNMDVLWRILLNIAGILHFYNPFAWFFAAEFEAVSEMVCDAGVIRNKGEQERRDYAELLIQMAEEGSKGIAWSAGISRNNKKIRERVEHVMRKDHKYFKKGFSVILVGVAVFLSSFTTFAYDDVKVWKTDATEATENSEKFFQQDVAFIPEGEDTTDISFFNNSPVDVNILYNTQFVDEAGNIYKMYDGAASVMWSCKHQYVNGQIVVHEKDSSGGCTVTYYSGQRCSKCGWVVYGEVIRIIINKTCDH